MMFVFHEIIHFHVLGRLVCQGAKGLLLGKDANLTADALAMNHS